ncbi:MAG: (2Fe-2S)-binding protein [Herbaspirillum sp.]|nr:(2Fe-2S)-binding protein [Herbaspirillum sp.]
MQQEFKFVVNGAPCSVTAAPDTPLLYVLRNDLQLKGTRFGCGAGACGSCTVMVDGRALQSCDTPLWSVQDCAITTVEGLGTPAAPHPVQQAFIDEQAAQCGYCINGIMMSVTALLAHTPAPDDAQLLAVLDRHLCRCGTHLRILRAARKAIELMETAR